MASTATLGMFIRLIFSLSVVIGLMWLAANMLKKRGMGSTLNRKAARSVQVELLAKRSMGRNSSIAVVRVGGKSMVVGITDHNVTKLDDTIVEDIDIYNDDDDDTTRTVSPGPAHGLTSAWTAMLDQMRSKTARR